MDKYINKEETIERINRLFTKNHDGSVAKNDYNSGLYAAKAEIVFITAADVQPVKRGRWITKAEEYYKAWQDSGRSWDDMPYFVTGLKFACSNCFEQFDVNAEGVEKWNGCPLCLARMGGDTR